MARNLAQGPRVAGAKALLTAPPDRVLLRCDFYLFHEKYDLHAGLEGQDDKQERVSAKLYIRGLISNGLGGAILYGLARSMPETRLSISLSVGLQLFVFITHGLPFSSEKFYDISGSLTHFALVGAALLGTSITDGGSVPRSARQLFACLASTVWMTRLGTFLFIRISRDGKDERFGVSPGLTCFYLG